VKVWDGKLWQDVKEESIEAKRDSPTSALGAFATKATPVRRLHFSHRNLLLGFGPFQSTKSVK
jgi:hypothetical protein